MCGVLITWWIGRKNNGPLGADGKVRGGNVNTRIVRLNPIDSTLDGKAAKKDNVGKEKTNSAEPDSKLNALREDTDTTTR